MEISAILLRPLSWVYINNALSGALANVFAVSLLHPLDTVRTRLQVQDGRRSKFSMMLVRDIYRAEGWSGLYRGWRSLVLSLTVTNFVYFYFFYGLKLNIQSDHQSFHYDLLFAVVAGILAVFISNPFWVVNTRLKLQTVKVVGRTQFDSYYAGIYDCFHRVREEEGLGAFSLGLTSSLLLVSNPALNFMIYEAQRRHLTPLLIHYIGLSTLFFVYGALSKFITTIVTYPLQFIQTRSRAGVKIIDDTAERKTASEWLAYFFRGIESKVTQTVMTSALMFLIFEHLRSALLSLFSS